MSAERGDLNLEERRMVRIEDLGGDVIMSVTGV